MRRAPIGQARGAIVIVALAIAAFATSALCAEPAPDPMAILAEAKAATGGSAWDNLRTQHTRVRISSAAGEGRVERWASILTGRSRMRLDFGRFAVLAGYDGLVSWVLQQGGRTIVESDAENVHLAANAAYRDRLAFWFPERHAATMKYLGRQAADGRSFDVIGITPDGGMAYEVWVSAASHRIERLREPQANETRTEVYSDFRDVQGVQVPYAVLVSRGDPKLDETYAVELLEYNVPLSGIDFDPPAR